MKVIKNEFFNEEIYHEELENGLNVYLMPKKGFVQYYAQFTTNFGSFDTEFIPLGENESITVPEGVAHFLEHKMFETEDLSDVNKLFLPLGASANAFTMHDRTSYTVSGTDHVNECIEILLDFVQKPTFTEETVEKEKSIIEQEILMYMDNPRTFASTSSYKNIFGTNDKLCREIGGTPESIKKITKDILLKAYHRFYHPANMVLAVVGGFDPVELMNTIKMNQSKKVFVKAHKHIRILPEQMTPIEDKNKIDYFNIKIPLTCWAVKFPYTDNGGLQNEKTSLALDYLFDIYYSSISTFNEEMRKNDLGEISIHYSPFYADGYAYCCIRSATNKYQKLYDFLDVKYNELLNGKIDEDKVRTLARSGYVSNIKDFNSITAIANTLIECHIRNIDFFELINLPNTINIKDLENVLQILKQGIVSTHTVLPK